MQQRDRLAGHGPHGNAEKHHRHRHGPTSRHDQGYHLLQVSNLSVGFRMYDVDAPFLSAEQHMVNATTWVFPSTAARSSPSWVPQGRARRCSPTA